MGDEEEVFEAVLKVFDYNWLCVCSIDCIHKAEGFRERTKGATMGACTEQAPDAKMFPERTHFNELSQMAEEAKRRAEIARLPELHTLKGHVVSDVRLKGLDIEIIQQSYTV